MHLRLCANVVSTSPIVCLFIVLPLGMRVWKHSTPAHNNKSVSLFYLVEQHAEV